MNYRLIPVLLTAFSGPTVTTAPVTIEPPPVMIDQQKVRPFANSPVIWPVKGSINSGFGLRWDPFSKHTSYHPGLDISGKMGQDVYAPADGKVISAKRSGEYGNLIIIEHEDGITTWYGHLSEYDVEVGDTVVRGEKIGEIGMTGRATGPHLHFEIRSNGQPIDPAKYILDTITAEIEKSDVY